MRYPAICIIIFFLILLNISHLEASILYTVPVEPVYPEEEIAWQEKVDGAGGELFSDAVGQYKRRDYMEALDRFRSVVERYPESEAAELASLYMGSIYLKMAKFKEDKDNGLLMNALGSFQKGVRRYSGSKNVPLALIEIGKIYLDMNLTAEAAGSFKRVIKGYTPGPEAAMAQYLLALTYEREGKYKEALLEYNMLSMKYPGDMEKERVFGTGNIFFALHEFGEARRLYVEGLKRWPAYTKRHPGILFKYSESQFQNGEFPAARDGFLALYNLYPKDKEAGFALNRVGDTYMLEQKGVAAERIYRNVLDLFPKSDDALISKLALGDLKFMTPASDVFSQDALKYYKEVEEAALRDSPAYLKARYRIGRVLEAEGKFKEALTIYHEVMDKTDGSHYKEASQSFYNLTGKIGKNIEGRLSRLDYLGTVKTYQSLYKPFLERISDERLLMEIADAHRRLLLYNGASEIYQMIIKRNSENRKMTLFKAGEMYFQVGDYLRAVETLGSYIADYPDGEKITDARVLMGEAFYKQKEYEKAANYFYAVIREVPYRYPGVHIELANILQGTGRYKDSANIMEGMIKHFPKERDAGILSLAYRTLGNAYYGLGWYQDALDAYNDGLNGGHPEEEREMMEFMKGDCLFRLNKRDDAKRIFLKLAENSKGLIKRISEERLKDIGADLSL